MILTSATLATLQTEINTDPQSLGYAAALASNGHQGVADALNLTRASITIRRSDITPTEIVTAITASDFVASPSASLLAWYQSAMACPMLRITNDDGSATSLQTNFKALLTAGSGSLNRLVALATRNGSRGEALFGPGVTITAQNVGQAKNGQL